LEKKRPTALIILDGCGLDNSINGNAVRAAKTPTMDWLYANTPNSSLSASGGSVGLMDGQMGDSNVGHLNLGPADCLPRRGAHFQDHRRWQTSLKILSFWGPCATPKKHGQPST
jgi:hypothetical protein